MGADPSLQAIFLSLGPNKVILQSCEGSFSLRRLNPTVATEHSVALLPPVLISCVSTVPSVPANSIMTRHFLAL
jgi:hypothetical protein